MFSMKSSETSDPDYDVFLTSRGIADADTSSEDTRRIRRRARELADELESRGIRVFDADDLLPGRPRQEQLEEIMKSVPVAVFVMGTKELDGWEELIQDVLTEEFVKRHLRLITVLLDGGPDADELTGFLGQFHTLECRESLEDRAIRQLAWAIRHWQTFEKVRGQSGQGRIRDRTYLDGVRSAEQLLPCSSRADSADGGSSRLLPLHLHEVESVGDAEGKPLEPDADLPELSHRLLDLCDRGGHALLVLGGPGSGKSTLLHRLVLEATDRADSSPFEPLPALLHLSRWRGGGLPFRSRSQRFSSWIVGELSGEPGASRDRCKSWEKREQLLLFLDGFDQVNPRLQSDCLRALDGYSRLRGSVPIVIASRTTELRVALEETGIGLKRWKKKVAVQPLDEGRVLRSLESHESLRRLVERDPDILELARTPLWLRLMVDNATGVGEILDSQKEGDLEEIRAAILDLAIDEGWKRIAGDESQLLADQRRVVWLARTLERHEPDVFYLEDLKPTWLDSKTALGVYAATTRGSAGLLLGASGLELVHGWGLPLLGLGGGLATGFVDWIRMLLFRRGRGSTPRWGRRWASAAGYCVATAAGWGAVVLLALRYLGDVPHLASAALLAGFLWLFFFLHGLRPVHDEIRTHTLQWRIPRSWRGPLALALLGVATGVVWSQSSSLFVSLVVTVVAVVVAVFGITFWGFWATPTRPETGWALSAALRDTLASAGKAGLWTASVTFLSSLAYFWIFRLGAEGGSLSGHLVRVFVISLPLIFGASLIFGGYSLLRHYVIRWILGFLEQLPYEPTDFLDRAADAAILQKAGRGHRFYHQLLRDRLASRPLPEPAAEILRRRSR